MGIDVLIYKSEKIEDHDYLFNSNQWNSLFYAVMKELRSIEEGRFWYCTVIIHEHTLPYIRKIFMKSKHRKKLPYNCTPVEYKNYVDTLLLYLEEEIDKHGSLTIDFG